MLHQASNIFHWVEVLILQSSKVLCVSLKQNEDPVPKRHYCFLFFFGCIRSLCDLRCIKQGLSLQCMDSLVLACGLNYSVACGILVPRPEAEPVPLALHSQ